ncbi:MAG: type ISP restriction/modification enzyme [Promethearchaeota archaeon]
MSGMDQALLTATVDYAREIRTFISNNMTDSLWSQLLETFPFPEIAHCEQDEIIEVFAQCVPLLTVFTHYVSQQSDLINQFLDNFMNWKKLNAKTISDFILPKIATEKSENRAYSTIITDLYVPFLKLYNRSMQEKRGIIFTPQYIITFMLSTLEKLLNEEFHIKTGLTSQEYLYYDPATGSLSFEMELLQILKDRGIILEPEVWKNQFFGNEINPAAYFLGKFVLESQLSQYSQISKGSSNFPLKIAFENALSPNFYESLQKLTVTNANLPRKPLLIVGNPPYAVSSANKGDWISDLMKKYAVPEPNITRLYDDYVKFFRYSDWLLEQHGSGIIALITNRKFLDGKIFYGFRKAMNETYDKIIIVDLMGDSRNVKQADAGDNVFNIQTGVCISFFCKFAENHKKKKIFPKEKYIQYTSITGTQSQIQAQLSVNFHNIKFESIIPISPHYLYLPIGIPPVLMKIWQHNGIPIPKFFEKTSRAMISSRDRFMIHHSKQKLLNNIDSLEKRDFQQLRNLKRIRKNYDPILENETVLKTFSFKEMKTSILPINYRPLDVRHTIFTTINQRCGKSIILDHIRLDSIPFHNLTHKKPTKSDSDNPPISQIHNFPQSLALNFVQSMQKPPFCHIWATLGLVDSGLFGYSTSKVAPLYLEKDGKPNFSPDILQKFHFLNPESRAETIFAYIYGILLCPEYGRLFQPILLHEYPRIFVMDTPLFPDFVKKIADLGENLVFLHIGELTAEIQDKIRHNLIQNFPQIPNAGKLISFRYIVPNSMLSLIFHTSTDNNEMEICINCPQILWDFRIGSVQVIKNWIKNRIYAKMENSWHFEDFHSLFTLLYIIENTCRIQRELDKVFLTHWDSFMTPSDIPD